MSDCPALALTDRRREADTWIVSSGYTWIQLFWLRLKKRRFIQNHLTTEIIAINQICLITLQKVKFPPEIQIFLRGSVRPGGEQEASKWASGLRVAPRFCFSAASFFQLLLRHT